MADQDKVYKCLNPVGISIPVETSAGAAPEYPGRQDHLSEHHR